MRRNEGGGSSFRHFVFIDAAKTHRLTEREKVTRHARNGDSHATAELGAGFGKR
jgi:hypothetical protein